MIPKKDYWTLVTDAIKKGNFGDQYGNSLITRAPKDGETLNNFQEGWVVKDSHTGLPLYDPNTGLPIVEMNPYYLNERGIDIAVSKFETRQSAHINNNSHGAFLVGDIYSVTNGKDVIFGNKYGDFILGGQNSDEIHGEGGDDIIFGEEGNDIIYGGEGDDIILGDITFPLITGYLDYHKLNSFQHNDQVYLESQFTALYRVPDVAGKNVLHGDDGNDTIYGGNDIDVLYGDEGDDRLDGGGGADSLVGGTGFDIASYKNSEEAVKVMLYSGIDKETNEEYGYGEGGDAQGDILKSIEGLIGSDFNDTLVGDANDNYLEGGAGDDHIVGGGGADTIDGGDGFDTLSYETSQEGVSISLVSTQNKNDIVIKNIEMVIGSNHNDIITGDDKFNYLIGGNGNDQLNGGAGNDTLEGGLGADILNGGQGIDTAVYLNSSSSVSINMNTNINKGGDAEGDRLVNINSIFGSNHNDIIIGNAAANTLSGGNGNDQLSGGVGVDTLIGGSGDDTLAGNADDDLEAGGLGNDYYLFGTGSGYDYILENANEGAQDVAYFVGITEINIFKNGNTLMLAANNLQDVMVLNDWYINKGVDLVYFADANALYSTQDIANLAYDITPSTSSVEYFNMDNPEAISIENLKEFRLEPLGINMDIDTDYLGILS